MVCLHLKSLFLTLKYLTYHRLCSVLEKKNQQNLSLFLKRMFLSHLSLGYLTGSEDYYTHGRCYNSFCGMDLRDNTNPTFANGSYSSELFADKVIDIVKNHDGDKVSLQKHTHVINRHFKATKMKLYIRKKSTLFLFLFKSLIVDTR